MLCNPYLLEPTQASQPNVHLGAGLKILKETIYLCFLLFPLPALKYLNPPVLDLPDTRNVTDDCDHVLLESFTFKALANNALLHLVWRTVEDIFIEVVYIALYVMIHLQSCSSQARLH